MQRHEFGEDWGIDDDGVDVVLYGPGQLEIVMRRFDVGRLTHEQERDPEILGTLRQIGWTYQLEAPEDGDAGPLELSLVLTWDSAQLERPMHGILYVGEHVSWQMPAPTAQALSAWCARQAHRRPVQHERRRDHGRSTSPGDPCTCQESGRASADG